jgi:hypothetical protein
MNDVEKMPVPLCPSAQPSMPESVVFGIVGGTVDDPRVAYLAEPLLVTGELLALTQPVSPTEVFRFAVPCVGHACSHFDGAKCRLVQRVTANLEPIVSGVPPCRIRPNCRWWQQEGKAACLRCPQIVTEVASPSELLHWVADPASPAEAVRLSADH